ncbi:hypothetical protein DI392_00215 [Vibrio albus]|uniref:Uncharacterized protein n=1 Tax=Vibrio albus TaxID=2200953 RepID=A0A2U3BDA0_9VIBR|nr:hypothetical protein [Vibrio albus]PWI34745.1 hypothetical protein DI392_00215 [Vibrio albus]
MDFTRLKITIQTLLVGLIFGLGSLNANAFAVDENFELDGNALEEVAVTGDDWETLHSGGGSAHVFTGIVADPSPQSIHGGGDKDILDIPAWSYKDGSVPDKDDITNAYAAAYGIPSDADPLVDDLVIYFGADRFANSGDAFMGFWFFQDQIGLDNGKFVGEHKVGDVLVLVNYPQASGAVPYLAVISWDPTCSKGTKDAMPGDCAAKNLRLEAQLDDTTLDAKCNEEYTNDDACAISNLVDTASPWAYTPKAGVPNIFPYESFFEGGINLSQIVGNTCFSSFMAETRSSSSFTAQLKDFVLRDFELCGIEITKTCPTGDLNATGDAIVYNYSILVENTGFGNVFDIEVVDTTAGEQTPIGDYMFSLDVLGAGETATFTGSFETLTSEITNWASVTAAIVDGGPVALEESDDAACPGLSVPGSMYVEKDCDVLVEANDSGAYGLRVDYSGQVCNDSEIKLIDVVLTEEHDGLYDTIDIGDLAPSSCTPYSGSYIPEPTTDVAPDGVSADQVRHFSDRMDAMGYTAIYGDLVEAIQVEATCKLCPDCPDCPTE